MQEELNTLSTSYCALQYGLERTAVRKATYCSTDCPHYMLKQAVLIVKTISLLVVPIIKLLIGIEAEVLHADFLQNILYDHYILGRTKPLSSPTFEISRTTEFTLKSA